MFAGYHKQMNQHALIQIDRTVDIPEPALGIGAAEMLAPIRAGVDYFYNLKQPRMVIPDIKAYDKAAVDGNSTKLTLDMFPAFGYMGEQLGGGM